MPGHERQRR